MVDTDWAWLERVTIVQQQTAAPIACFFAGLAPLVAPSKAERVRWGLGHDDGKSGSEQTDYSRPSPVCPRNSPLPDAPTNPDLPILPPASTLFPVNYEHRITIEADKRGGKPCIRGLRITVYDVLDYLAGGMTEQEILADFPDLTAEDLKACLTFATEREDGRARQSR